MAAEVGANVDSCLTFVEHQQSYNARKCKNKEKRMSARALLDTCCKLLESFIDRASSLCDNHSAIVIPSSNVMHRFDVLFFKQVLCGYCRYKGLLQTFISKLYSHKAAHVQPQDKSLFIVLAYLILIHLDKLTFPILRKLVFCHAQKVLPLLQFIFNTDELIQHCKVEWLKIYDVKYIEALIGNVLKWFPEATELIQSLEMRTYAKYRREERMKTSPEPFMLSTSKRKPIEKDKGIEVFNHTSEQQPFKAKPAPIWKDGPTLTRKKLEVVFNGNKRRQEEYYSHPKNQPFNLHVLERPSNLEHIRKEAESKFKKENKIVVRRPQPCPVSPGKEIRSTTTTILREHAVYQKQISAEKIQIDAFELELRDDAAFRAWKKEMQLQAKAAETLRLQFKKADVVATAQAVRDACAFKDALAKMVKQRKERVHTIQAETTELASEVAARRAVELLYKQELVRQLRALELESAHAIKTFDHNSTANHRVPAEMSIYELQECLKLMKAALKHEEDCRRSAIAASKEEKQKMLAEKLEMIKRMRGLSHAYHVSKHITNSNFHPWSGPHFEESNR